MSEITVQSETREIQLIQESLPPQFLISSMGLPGPSAYQSAVANGYEGTEQEWLLSLQAVGPVRGSNTNGEFVKFPDGTLICTKVDFDLNYINTSTLNGDWVFPHPFIDGNRVVTFSLQRRAGVAPPTNYKSGINFDDTNSGGPTQARMAVLSNGVFTDNGPLAVRATAIGRWY